MVVTNKHAWLFVCFSCFFAFGGRALFMDLVLKMNLGKVVCEVLSRFSKRNLIGLMEGGR